MPELPPTAYAAISFEREALEHFAVLRERTASIEAKMGKLDDHERRITDLEHAAWRLKGMVAASLVVCGPVVAWATDYVRVHLLGVVFHPIADAAIQHILP